MEKIIDSIKVTLTKRARSIGGDRYEGTYNGQKFTIWVPQSISRLAGTTPKRELTVTFS